MIKKIITPTDFSDAANNAIEYAAKLALVLDAELDLVNVQRIIPVASAVSPGDSLERNIKNLNSKKLKELSEEVNKTFKVTCNYEMEMTTQSLSKTLAALGKEDTMIVMGTNGADGIGQFFFGTNTYNVIKKAECPVLLVPENYPYGTYQNILYAFTYEEKGKLALNQFYEFAKNFDTKITFLHVSKKDTSISRDVFNAAKEEVEEYFIENRSLDFKRVFANDVAGAIDEFTKENPVDLLVMAARQRNIIQSILKKRPILEGLGITTNYPLLVFHS